jgi:hypothetical protein
MLTSLKRQAGLEGRCIGPLQLLVNHLALCLSSREVLLSQELELAGGRFALHS